jgi:CBS-domain-containing membrane protein
MSADVISKPVITVRDDESLGVAATRMAEHGIKRLPVLDKQGKLVGVLSRVDVLQQVTTKEAKKRLAKVPSGAARTLGKIMLSEIPGIQEDALLADVIVRFLQAGTRRLIVVDAQGKAIGLVDRQVLFKSMMHLS